MAFGFRKRIKLLPGISLNLGKRSISSSSGIRGAHVTLGKRRTTTSIGVPGTGLYDRQTVRHQTPERPPDKIDPATNDGRSLLYGVLFIVALGLIAKGLSML